MWNGGALFFSQEGQVPAELQIQAGAVAPVRERWVERDTWLPVTSCTRRVMWEVMRGWRNEEPAAPSAGDRGRASSKGLYQAHALCHELYLHYLFNPHSSSQRRNSYSHSTSKETEARHRAAACPVLFSE